jgi:glycosyltransferase involved in cell wall biosynthesis
MAMGLPIIGTNIRGIRELVRNYKTGILFNDYDIHGLTEAITYFIDNPDRIEVMGQASREWILSQGLTWNNTAKAYLDLFSSTVQ